jgi:hypothetical protein
LDGPGVEEEYDEEGVGDAVDAARYIGARTKVRGRRIRARVALAGRMNELEALICAEYLFRR